MSVRPCEMFNTEANSPDLVVTQMFKMQMFKMQMFKMPGHENRGSGKSWELRFITREMAIRIEAGKGAPICITAGRSEDCASALCFGWQTRHEMQLEGCQVDDSWRTLRNPRDGDQFYDPRKDLEAPLLYRLPRSDIHRLQRWVWLVLFGGP